MHHHDVPDEIPERHKLAPRATGRHAAVTHSTRAAPETPLAHHATENRPRNNGVPWFERLDVRISGPRNPAITVRFDDREFFFSASERGETQR